MTTTEPTSAWLDELVPIERRETGRRLIEEVEALRDSIEPLLDRFVAHYLEHAATYTNAAVNVRDACGADVVHVLSDGLEALLGEIDGVSRLFGLLGSMGVDPDEVIDGRSDYFERRQQVA